MIFYIEEDKENAKKKNIHHKMKARYFFLLPSKNLLNSADHKAFFFKKEKNRNVMYVTKIYLIRRRYCSILWMFVVLRYSV